jgi:DNA-binding CsgD family transcriptional regulator
LKSAQPQPKVHQLSDVLFDPRQLPRLEFFRKHLAPKGWHHIARMTFGEQAKCIAEITILRTAGQGPFTDHEMALLDRLHSHIDATIRRVTDIEKRFLGTSPSSGLGTQVSTLTATERELVALMRTGLSNKEISGRLHKSVRTVKTQITSIYRKLGVRSRSRLLAMMMAHS